MKSRAMQNAMGVLLFLTALFILSGCENNEGNDWERLVCDVQLTNEGNPLIAAYLHAGADREVGTDDDYTPIDTVPVVFHARPYSSTVSIPEDGPYSWFQVERYDLEWENNPMVPVDLTLHNVYDSVVDIMVPVNDEAGASVLVCGIDMKNTSWFTDVYTGDLGSFQADCHITFYGHESGSSEEIALETGLRVQFISVIVTDS